MRNRLQGLCLSLLCGLAPTAHAAEILDHGRIEHLHLYRPDGPARSTALLLSDKGWDADAAGYAEALRRHHTLVAGIDTAALMKKLARDGGDCAFLDGDLDNLGRFVQAYTHQDDFRPPILLGLGEGAALAFGLLAQAPAKTFSGGIGVGFEPRAALKPPLCQGSGLKQRADGDAHRFLPSSRLRNAFTAIAPSAPATAFLHAVPLTQRRAAIPRHGLPPSASAAALMAYLKLADTLEADTPRRRDALPDLPLIEVLARRKLPAHADTFAVLMSGDGGWAGIDEELAERLSERGMAVVGFDSLRYFWTPRTPDDVAADIARVVEHYAGNWERPRVLLLGYSQGGDVLPFVLNRLPAATRARVAMAGALSLSRKAAFEFHVGSWVAETGTIATAPEVAQLAGDQGLLIVCGREDEDAICPTLDAKKHRMLLLPGSHHFDGDYDALADQLLDALDKTPR